MTAFIIDRQQDRAVVLTDGAVCVWKAGAYQLGAIERKVKEMPHIAAAMVFAGAANVAWLTADVSLGCESFDEFLEKLPAAVDAGAREAHQRWPHLGAGCIFAVVGWSTRRDRWETWSIEKDAEHIFAPPVVVEQDDATIALPRVNPAQYREAMARGGDDRSAVLVELMKMQRLHREVSANRPEAGEVYTIGGHILETVVTRDGVKSKVVHRWPDKIGEPLRGEP